MKMKKPQPLKLPFNSPAEEADAILGMLEGNLPKKIGSYSALRLAAFRSDAMKQIVELRLLTYSQSC